MPLQLIRFTQDGAVDPVFRDGGTQPVDYSFSSTSTSGGGFPHLVFGNFTDTSATRVLIDASGYFYVAGEGSSAPGLQVPVGSPQQPGPLLMAVARFRPDGDQDQDFFESGINVSRDRQQEAIRIRTSVATDIALDFTGRIVIGGEAILQESSGEIRWRVAVSRFHPSGSVDTSFGGGMVTSPWGAQGRENGYALAIGPGRRIVVVGSTGAVSQPQILILRYRNDGRPDSTFGENGRVVEAPFVPRKATGVAIDHLGRIIVSAVSDEADGAWVLLRYLPTGDRDPQFGATGEVRTDVPSDFGAKIHVMIDAQDRIVCVGTGTRDGPGQGNGVFVITRHLPNGRRDSTFGGNGNGIKVVPFPPFLDSAATHSLGFDRLGRMVVAGGVVSQSGQTLGQIGLVRLRENGNEDPTFGSGGRVVTTFKNQFSGVASVVIDAQNRPVVAATSV